MATTPSALFTGSSQFSSELQNAITQAVSAASQPITQLNNELTMLQNQSSALSGLSTDFTALQAAIQQIGDATGSGSLSASVSDPSVVSATLGSGASPGQYSIEVQDAGAYATSLTKSAWTGGSGSSGSYQLVVGSNTYDLSPADSSAASVAAAINTVAGNQVQATVVNVGSSGSPDERIALQATTLGAQTLDILDNGTSLQTQQTTGQLAQYIVDNSGHTVTSDSPTVQIANGLTVDLLASDPGNPVTIDVTQSWTALSNALSGFVSAYNTASSALSAQHGQNAGALGGDPIVDELGQTLSQIATYFASSSGSIGSLADLGVTLNNAGQMAFDSSAFGAAILSASASDITGFLGSADAGGFLQMAANALNGIEDPTTGLLPNAESSTTSQITSVNQQISDKQDQVNQLQQNLTQQMNSADAAIASMEQQFLYLNGLFQAMQTEDLQYVGE